ncbi:phosphoribosylformylglycinamidine synthase subunit PurS [Halarsenatibacter silvermanii]|uniref:Phosphoribosylformylglycinamidine synthase subunit PurS n=1 Tax=Halarsenatibacter silvermanii TaxID=321763 RepID=A0A1G9HE17_9FIRM|nr:phosphoribosylformylglycinamidine synthase subunit PurS [Halarsenatibacter silvermanii]SDL11102.1 phosphoribosylformylglycinamidine synthase [Halarsenatibacter silvermanii]
MDWQAKVKIQLKENLLDPQGQAVGESLAALGYENVKETRVGRYIELKLEDVESQSQAEEQLEEMCERLLANPVIEDFRFQVEELS